MLPGVYYYYPVTSIGKHTHYTVRDYNTRHTRASTALSAAVALMSRAVFMVGTQVEMCSSNLSSLNNKTKFAETGRGTATDSSLWPAVFSTIFVAADFCIRFPFFLFVHFGVMMDSLSMM